MTNTTAQAFTPEQRHIESLRAHGAQVLGPDGNRTELTASFVNEAVNSCIRNRCNAITYDLFLPDIEEPMMIAVWRDGHVDTGNVRNICDCLASR